ncbi:unnamed protein product [Cercopithifilaria johnstoni]|uniref:Integrase catalytic domain-containing protein n=1 Tax=Cercopithifilaria johnstoni TaxID=2874296 RepID=A0A8J2MCD2_9BILA|nr:unnamed protein product [Cercopithifilaria johnstoni]
MNLTVAQVAIVPVFLSMLQRLGLAVNGMMEVCDGRVGHCPFRPSDPLSPDGTVRNIRNLFQECFIGCKNFSKFFLQKIRDVPKQRAAVRQAIKAEDEYEEHCRKCNWPMLRVNIDIVKLEKCVYNGYTYEMMLFVTDMYSNFVFARALPSGFSMMLLVEYLSDIFSTFSPPKLFTSSSDLVKLAMTFVEDLYKIEIFHLQGEESLVNDFCVHLNKRAAENGLTSQWVDILPSVVFGFNQRILGDKLKTPFQLMFNRKPAVDSTRIYG